MKMKVLILIVATALVAYSANVSAQDNCANLPGMKLTITKYSIDLNDKRPVCVRVGGEFKIQIVNPQDGGHEVSALMMEQPDSFQKWWASPEKEFFNSLLGDQIRQAMEELPEVFRVTIQLINVDGLGYDEAAAVLGIPTGTVRSRMKRGRTLLQKALWQQARDEGLQQAGKGTLP